MKSDLSASFQHTFRVPAEFLVVITYQRNAACAKFRFKMTIFPTKGELLIFRTKKSQLPIFY